MPRPNAQRYRETGSAIPHSSPKLQLRARDAFLRCQRILLSESLRTASLIALHQPPATSLVVDEPLTKTVPLARQLSGASSAALSLV